MSDSLEAGGSAEPASEPISGLATWLTRRRQLYGLAVAVVGAPLLTAAILPGRERIGLDTALLLYVLVSVTASAVGGVLPALLASLISFGLANFFFAPPYGSLLLASSNELIDLMVFLAVSALVGVVAELGARARERAQRSRVETEWLAELGSRDFGPQSVQLALAEACRLYDMHAAALTESGRELAASGVPQAGDTELRIPAGDGLLLVLHGPARVGADRGLLSTLALTTGRLWRTQRLAEQAQRAEELARIDELRASLLTAVGHDLRNPLAAISAAAATLREPGLALSDSDRDELLGSVETGAQRLDAIIGNLLDASRLRAGAVSVRLHPTALAEVLAPVLRLGEVRVDLDLPEDLPLLSADAGLLERVLANLVDNADRHEPAGRKVRIRARAVAGPADEAGSRRRFAEVQVIDHGPGIPPERLAEIFAPFQRFGDRLTGGLGLGLAIARGFTEAMGGTLTASATPGGGLTMTVRLEVADAQAADR